MNVVANLTRLKYLSLLAILLLPLASVPTMAATGTVDVNTVYQQLEGFGASGAWWEGMLTNHPLEDELYDILFGELGLDIYRVRNAHDQYAGSVYIYRSSVIINGAEESLGHPIKVLISSWSPPEELKSNGSTVGGTLKKDPCDGEFMYEEFAEWWDESLDAWAVRGVEPEYISMQNEPDYIATHDSCFFTRQVTQNYANYNLAFEAVYDELSSRENCPKFLAPETCGMTAAGEYIDTLNTSHAYGYAHHLYSTGEGNHNNPDDYIPTMTSFAAGYGDSNKPLMQTEFGPPTPLTFYDAMNQARLMHNSLTIEGVSAYFYWELFWGEEAGEDDKGLVTLSSSSYTINPVYYAFKQYSAFTDPNWYRVDASTDSSDLRISAFKNPDCTGLSIVIINDATSGISLSLSLENFIQTGSEVYRTSATEETAYVGTFDESVPIVLPGTSITTISLAGYYSLYESCAEAITAGYRLTSDIDGGGDCYVNYEDLDVIIGHWPTTSGCGSMSNCDGADFEPDDDVDFADFSEFGLQWMQCNDPEDTGCTPNW